MDSIEKEEQGTHNRDFVNLQVHSHITRLFKANLSLFDKVRVKYNISKEDSEEIRKEILDSGNDAIRDIHNLIDVFDFYISPSRLEQAKSARKVVKKVVCGGSYS